MQSPRIPKRFLGNPQGNLRDLNSLGAQLRNPREFPMGSPNKNIQKPPPPPPGTLLAEGWQNSPKTRQERLRTHVLHTNLPFCYERLQYYSHCFKVPAGPRHVDHMFRTQLLRRHALDRGVRDRVTPSADCQIMPATTERLHVRDRLVTRQPVQDVCKDVHPLGETPLHTQTNESLRW